jgi:hypothetical protein
MLLFDLPDHCNGRASASLFLNSILAKWKVAVKPIQKQKPYFRSTFTKHILKELWILEVNHPYLANRSATARD